MSWERDELRTERRRSQGWYRNDPPDIDIHKHEPTERDRYEVEPPLDREQS